MLFTRNGSKFEGICPGKLPPMNQAGGAQVNRLGPKASVALSGSEGSWTYND